MTDAASQAGGQSGNDPKPGDAGSGSPSKPGSQGSGTTSFTQEQVQSFVAEAVKRERARYGDYDEVKSRLADIESAGQTELEKANARAADAELKSVRAVERANAMLIKTAITAEAARAGAIDPDVIVALLADDFEVKDDEIVGDIAKAVAKMLAERPYLRATAPMKGVG